MKADNKCWNSVILQSPVHTNLYLADCNLGRKIFNIPCLASNSSGTQFSLTELVDVHAMIAPQKEDFFKTRHKLLELSPLLEHSTKEKQWTYWKTLCGWCWNCSAGRTFCLRIWESSWHRRRWHQGRDYCYTTDISGFWKPKSHSMYGKTLNSKSASVLIRSSLLPLQMAASLWSPNRQDIMQTEKIVEATKGKSHEMRRERRTKEEPKSEERQKEQNLNDRFSHLNSVSSASLFSEKGRGGTPRICNDRKWCKKTFISRNE